MIPALRSAAVRFLDTRPFIGLLRDTFGHAGADNIGRMAAALAYYSVFSIAPALLIALAIAGLAIGPGTAQERLRYEIDLFAGPRAADGIQSLLLSSHEPATGTAATVFGLLALAFGGSGVFMELRESLETILGSRRPRRTGLARLIKVRFFAFLMVFIGSLAVVAGMFGSALLQVALSDVSAVLPSSRRLIGGADAALLLVVSTAVFTLIYREVPRPKPAWLAALAGAIFAGVLFVAGEFLLTLYLGRTAPASPVGAAGSVLALLVWVYYSAQTFYLGAEFARSFAQRREPFRNPSP